MAKKNGSKVLTALLGGAATRVTAQAFVDKKNYKIINAKITDDFCHYGYEITTGVGLGDVHPGVKGGNLIKDEMRDAFARLRVHLAVIADFFKFHGIAIDDIDKLHSHEITQLFYVTGFKIKGDEESETIQLMGNYHISSGARMDLETPPIHMDNLSSYKWRNELKDAADSCRGEVALYKEGYYTPVKEDEEDDDIPKAKQMKITDSVGDEFDNE